MYSRGLLLLLIAILTVSCKETYSDIGHEPEMKARLDAFIEEMAVISDGFPMEPQPIDWTSDELLAFFGRESQNTNALLVDTHQLSFIDSDVGFNKEHFFEVGPRHYLVHTLGDRHDGQKEAPEGYQEELEEILGLRFIVAVFVMYDEPVIDVENRTFSGGGIKAIVGVYDRRDSVWLGGFRCSADPPDKVNFKINAEWKYRRDGNYYLRSNTEGRLEKEILGKLAPFTEKSLMTPVETLEEAPAIE